MRDSRLISLLVVAFAMVVPQGTHAEEPADLTMQVRDAIQRSVPYLEREGAAWIEKRDCVSCHQVPFMLWGLNAAHASGAEIDEAELQKHSDWSLTWQSWQNPKNENESDEASVAKGNVDTLYFLLLGRQAYEQDEQDAAALANMQKLILANQQDDGSFKPGGQLPKQRRPLPETTQISTMWALLALPPDETDQPRTNAREKALAYLDAELEKKPSIESTEWIAARYLLEEQLGAREAAAQRITELLEKQNDDGGWGWLVDEESNAFGTGVALYALSQAHRDARGDKSQLANAIGQGQQFLITTQGEDGAWLVPSTKSAGKGKPRPTSNYWGTAWAVIGLCESIKFAEPTDAR